MSNESVDVSAGCMARVTPTAVAEPARMETTIEATVFIGVET
jgi:hypothetical protein